MVKPLFYGRMGNVLYQAACGISYALKHGLEFTVPSQTTSEKWNPLYLQHLVNPNWDGSLPTVHIKEKRHEYIELPYEKSWEQKNLIIDGYFQSYKYFNEYRQKILDLFGFKWEMKNNFVSVHIRRGDYLELVEKHPPVPEA